MRILTVIALLLLVSGKPVMAVTLESVIEGLTAPINIADPDDGSDRLFVLEQHGVVQTLKDATLGEPLLDLRPHLLELRQDFEERGLLGFALHPDFNTNGRVYVSYSAPLRETAPQGWNHTRRVSELTLMPGESQIGLGTERVLIELDWPSRKHNGGGLAFGPDGYLYIGLGDGGGAHGVGPETLWSAFEVQPSQLHWDRLAQDLTTLHGKILRIDVETGFPGYGIPPTNPLVGKPGHDAIWAWGVRNPYRLGIDQKTGAILLTAVAETLWEAIYLIDAPTNLGWPIREGTHCVDRLRPRVPPPACPRHGPQGYPIADPVVEYGNMQLMHPETKLDATGVGTAVVGARIYRGAALPDLKGKLIFADWSLDFRKPSGQLFVATPSPSWGDLWQFEKLMDLDTRIVGMAQDASNEIYILTNDNFGPYGDTGKIFRLAP
jgi:glucose/arabinose dehydrogenase